MPKKSDQYPIPKFNNLEEEDKFWQSHSPLMEDYKGKVQKRKQNRASFLSVRLTGEELAYLKEKATQYSLGPSTYARQILVQAIRAENKLGSLEEKRLPQILDEMSENIKTATEAAKKAEKAAKAAGYSATLAIKASIDSVKRVEESQTSVK